jgi:hypothetical protein
VNGRIHALRHKFPGWRRDHLVFVETIYHDGTCASSSMLLPAMGSKITQAPVSPVISFSGEPYPTRPFRSFRSIGTRSHCGQEKWA